MALICDACSKQLQLKTFCEDCYLNAHRRLNDMETVANSKDTEIQILKDDIEGRKLGARQNEQKVKSLEKDNERLGVDILLLETKIKKLSEESRAQEFNPEN